ncbi:2-amino-4-hydroxy-6-hydroxymethyldihydropteridine diphosphokinase [Geovibrio thiophilus]|uniref:2-amino-4-hydroxy-6-hydroxymethyldihydropteridine pyrophosphokinase n=1 Tax=Geovibrio thiophilus TaxID=139438 RepID=A0A3R6AY60_9BACT|nr:2-amino-4-hydroxy-6-hydroxymethyldihydropteridine diphosphokinase [Geovibrio thiophilus]QAR33263.1 2-amino-4-hydroxy-6-hydroxymethyldihydropteridine diphosphokinase [Geovibrio thiophilus]
MNSVRRIILALGSNIGDRERNFADALKALSSLIIIDKVSSVYSTASLLRDGQADYYNICCSGCTGLSTDKLLTFIKKTEKELGREQSARWQSRLIDIDIIDFGGEIHESEGLAVPHKETANRSFVLYPLRDVDADYVHPVSGMSIDRLIAGLKDDLDIKKIGDLSWR